MFLSGFPVGGDLAVDLAHTKSAAAVLPGFLAYRPVGRRCGSDVPDVVAHAHDNDVGFQGTLLGKEGDISKVA